MFGFRIVLACRALALTLALAAPLAHAGLEFCFTPECSDGDPCTCDFKMEDGSCSHDPRTRWAAAARAHGISADLGGHSILRPTPDSNVKNPDTVLDIPADPLAQVSALHVEELEENPNNRTESHARAAVTTGAVKVLDQGAGHWLLTVDSIESVSESYANSQTATSSTDGSTLHHVVLNGTNLGDVKESMDFTFLDPLTKQRIDVRLLQKIRVGAAAGSPVPDPEFGVTVSGVTVNAVRVTVRDVTDSSNPVTEAEIIVARADTRVDRFGRDSCKVVSPKVSGNGFVIGINADESALDSQLGLTRTRLGEVVLPSRGGHDDSNLASVGPLLDPSGNLLLEANTAYSHTEGQTDQASGSAQSATVSAVEGLRALDRGEGPVIRADLVRAECISSTDDGSATPQTTLVGLTLAGSDVCGNLGLESPCAPAPNTRITNDPDLDIVVNEQAPDPPSSGCAGVTVNAVHIHALGARNRFGLPLGADVVISRAHCDVCRP